jgi:hypothetical protein
MIHCKIDKKSRVRLFATCDLCDGEITNDRPGNCEFFDESGSPVFFVHKDCSRSLRAGHPEKMVWIELNHNLVKGLIS